MFIGFIYNNIQGSTQESTQGSTQYAHHQIEFNFESKCVTHNMLHIA